MQVQSAAAATVEVRWATLDAASPALLRLLSRVETDRLECFTRAADRARSMLGASLLRQALGARIGLEPAAVPIERSCHECGGHHGAPRVPLPGAPWASVTHSGLLVGIALAPAPVGIDVQRDSDLACDEDAERWVCAEAVAKVDGAVRAANAGPERDVVARSIAAPLPGYAAALALPARCDAPLLHVVGP